MDTKTKILLGVAILLVVIYIVVTGAGLVGSRGGPISLDQPWVKSIGDSLAAPQGLQAKDMQSSNSTCLDGETLVIARGASCTYTIQTSSASTRRLRVQLPAGAVVGMTLDQPKALTAHLTVTPTPVPPPGPTPTPALDYLDVYKDGGTLTIGCSGVPCRLPLVH